MFRFPLILIISFMTSCRPAGDKVDRTTEDTVYQPGSKVVFTQTTEGDAIPLITLPPAKVCSDISYFDQDGTRVQGTRNCEGGDNTDSGATISECVVEGTVGCLTTAAFKATSTEGLNAKVLAGQSVAGLTGIADSMDCVYGSQSSCEAESKCQWKENRCIVNPWHIRVGITISGTTGLMKTNCRNLVNSAVYNSDSMPPGNALITTGVNIDWWDTIGHHNQDLPSLPKELPTGWTSDHACAKELWTDVTSDGACDAAEDDCMMKDNVTGLVWSEGFPTSGIAPTTVQLNWSAAIDHCHNLEFGGRSDWRLPTQLEALSAQRHGIRELGYKGGGTIRPDGDTRDNNDYYMDDADMGIWTATSNSSNGGQAYHVYLASGGTNPANKTNTGAATTDTLCVAP